MPTFRSMGEQGTKCGILFSSPHRYWVAHRHESCCPAAAFSSGPTPHWCPKAEGDGTPFGQRLLCVLAVVYRIWACVPDSVLSAGQGVSCVDAWYSTTLDMEQVFSDACQGDFHIFVAGVVKLFDTADRDTHDCALRRLGLPAWFRRVYFAFHCEVRVRTCYWTRNCLEQRWWFLPRMSF